MFFIGALRSKISLAFDSFNKRCIFVCSSKNKTWIDVYFSFVWNAHLQTYSDQYQWSQTNSFEKVSILYSIFIRQKLFDLLIVVIGLQHNQLYSVEFWLLLLHLLPLGVYVLLLLFQLFMLLSKIHLVRLQLLIWLISLTSMSSFRNNNNIDNNSNRNNNNRNNNSSYKSRKFIFNLNICFCWIAGYPISCFASATASNFYSPAGTVTQQLDGLLDRPNTSGGTYFHSGALPPQWIKLELPGLFNILTITLQVIQSPNGPTRHQISVGSSSSSLQIVTDLSSSTINGQILNFTYNPILTNVRFIRLTTITSPSWVAWQKLIVYDF